MLFQFHGRPQAWSLALWKCCQVFLCIILQHVIGFWEFLPDPTGASSLDPLGYFCPRTLNLPTPGKNPAGAHAVYCYIYRTIIIQEDNEDELI